MSTTASGGSGLFAKFVAKFLVKWIKKTRDKNRGEQPALSATPSPLTGPRPDRDRTRENFGAHTGASGVRASAAPAAAQAVQGGSYGEHAGSSGPRPGEASQPVSTVQGGTYGEHRGSAAVRAQQPAKYTAGSRPTWSDLVRQEIRALLQRLADAILRELGLGERQSAQAQQGYVPAGHQVSPAGQGQWQLTATSPESQLATHQHHTQTAGLASGQTATLSLPSGGRATVLILEVSA